MNQDQEFEEKASAIFERYAEDGTINEKLIDNAVAELNKLLDKYYPNSHESYFPEIKNGEVYFRLVDDA